jgi:putative addiction module killer protein
VGGGVFEMVIHYGPGYRLYYCQRGKGEYLLLTGGTKKRQQADIERAKEIKGEGERGDRW